MVDMIDCAVGYLGPDLEPLQEDLVDLGKRHIAYGVKTEFLPSMERAVMYALEDMMDDSLTKEDRAAWGSVFTFMIRTMVKGM